MLPSAKPIHEKLSKYIHQSSFNFENFANADEMEILSPGLIAEMADTVSPLKS